MTHRPWISRPFLAATLALTILFTLLLAAVTRLAVNEKDWRRRKQLLDAASAAVILQDYLDTRVPAR